MSGSQQFYFRFSKHVLSISKEKSTEIILESLYLLFNSDVNKPVPHPKSNIFFGVKFITSNLSIILSVDFSFEMLKTCFEKDVKSSFVCADIEYLPFKSMNFDLVISNFTLHWCQNLQKILLDVQNNLTDQGIFFFSTLGPDSLSELREAFLEQKKS